MESYQKLGLTNQFENKVNGDTINFRNDTMARDNVSSIEITKKNPWVTPPGSQSVEFKANVDDNVAMALSLLGVGRVTEDVQRQAQQRADQIVSEMNTVTSDGVLTQAIVNLRAILIAKQKLAEQSEKTLDDAYALYRLAYPDGAVTRSEFPEQSMCNFWVANLSKIRQDPTLLGAL